MVSLLFLISRMTQWSPVSFFTSLLIAYSLFTRTIPTFTKHFCWNSCQNQALLPRLPSTNIFRFLVYTTLSHSLPPPSLSLSLTFPYPLQPAQQTADPNFPADLMNSNYGQRWPIWGRRHKSSRGLFRLQSGFLRLGTSSPLHLTSNITPTPCWTRAAHYVLAYLEVRFSPAIPHHPRTLHNQFLKPLSRDWLYDTVYSGSFIYNRLAIALN